MTTLPPEGRRRVAIDGISPMVDGGRFAAKAIVGDRLPVHVDAFPDGHDEIRVVLRHLRPGSEAWDEIEMAGPDDDRWTAQLTLREIGLHLYDVAAWVDDWKSWRRDLQLRVDGGVLTDVDIAIGRSLVEAAADHAPGPDGARLSELATSLIDAGGESVTVAAGDELAELMRRNPDRELASSLPEPLRLVVDPVHARFGAWYELFPRSASPDPERHGTLRDVEARLPYVERLGFDVLYLPPVHPIGQSFRKGPNDTLDAGPDDPGVPWAIGDETGGHTAIHPQLGTLDDLDALVAAAGRRGIRIALDIAFQASPDHPWTRGHRDWFRERPDGTIQYAENPPKKYQDALPLDFETGDWQALWKELLGVIRHWVDHGVRIFRVDNPHTKPFAFWEWLIGEIKATEPDVIFLAEAFTRPKVMYRLAKLGFSQSYTYFTWRNERAELEAYFRDITEPPISDTFRPNLFTNTPDILHAFLQDGGPTAFEIRLVLAATLGATYGIYGPPFELTEATPRHAGSEEYLDSEKYQQRHWELDDPRSLAPLISRINELRREHPALQSDTSLRFHASSDDAVIAYTKHDTDGDDVILILVNLDPHADHRSRITLRTDGLGLDGDIAAEPLLDAAPLTVDDDGFETELGASSRPYAIHRLHQTGGDR